MIYKKLYSGYPVSIYDRAIVVSVDKNNDTTKSFIRKFVDITPEQASVKTRAELNSWFLDPMLFYFNQYKLALYCASTLCGVCKDDLTRGFALTRAIMNFHVMYQTKRILRQMQCKMPGDDDFNPNNNPYNKSEYHKLLNEFDISPDDIPQVDQPSKGLGYLIGEMRGKLSKQHYYEQNKIEPPLFLSTGEKNWYVNANKTDFDGGVENYPNYAFKDDNQTGFIETLSEIKQDIFHYQRLIADHKSQVNTGSRYAFPERGIVRINDSIRTYIYCLLGAQTEVRSDFMSERSLDAEQKFLELVNDLINKKQSIEESIDNFQDALSKTKGAINYVIAKGIYEIPSDLNLNKLQRSVSGFNTELITASSSSKLGFLKPNSLSLPNRIIPTPVTDNNLTKAPQPEENQVHVRVERDEHEGSKLFIGGLTVLGGILYYKFM